MAVAQHFGLDRDPFARAVDPADVFESGAFVAARDGILRELQADARLVALIGAAGTGKTLVLQAVERALATGGRAVCRLDRADRLGEARAGEVLLVDEADRLGDRAIAALADATPATYPAVVLAFTRRRLDHLNLAARPRSVLLEEIGASDARDFVTDRLRRAGGEPSLFTPGALGALTYAAAGSPRLLRLLASGAMFQAAQDGANRIEMGHARRAIAVQRGGAAVELPAEDPVPAAVEPVAPAPISLSPRAEREAAIVSPSPAPTAPVIAVAPLVEQAEAVEEPLILEVAEPTASEATAEEEPRAASARRPMIAAVVALLVAVAGGTDLWQTTERLPPRAPASAAAVKPIERPAEVAGAPPPVAAPAPKLEPIVEPSPAPAAEAEVAAGPVEPEPATAPPEPEAPPPPRVVVRYAGGQPGAADAAGRIADLLRARGYEVADVRAATGRIRQASTRYAAGERQAGEAVNTAFETALRAYQPGAASRATPNAEGDEARGTIEVWVPDSAAGASRPLRTDVPPS